MTEPKKLRPAEARKILKRGARMLTKDRLIRAAEIVDAELMMHELERNLERRRKEQSKGLQQLNWLEQAGGQDG